MCLLTSFARDTCPGRVNAAETEIGKIGHYEGPECIYSVSCHVASDGIHYGAAFLSIWRPRWIVRQGSS
jgi:hypothetical protein